VRTNAQAIVTFNLKHFPEAAIAPWNVIAQTPDDFLVHQYHLDAGVVVQKLHEQAAKRGGIEGQAKSSGRAPRSPAASLRS
jgi:hypothetical protein